MRLVTIKTPTGQGTSVVDVAFAAGIAQASIHQVHVHRPKQSPVIYDVIEVETATPVAKTFVEALLIAPFFDPASSTVAIRHPRSLITHEPPARETLPTVVPTADVFEELWQFSHVTVSLIGRVFLAALLGLRHD